MSDPSHCRTCGVAYKATPVFDADEGIMLPPSAYCSIHCEHYDGLARAARRETGEA